MIKSNRIVKFIVFYMVCLLLHGTAAEKIKKSVKTLAPANISKSMIPKNGFYSPGLKSSLLFNFKGPGILKIIVRKTRTEGNVGKSPIYILYSLDGRKSKKKIIPLNRKSYSFKVNPGIGHHTVGFLAGPDNKACKIKLLFSSKNEKKREWQSIPPVSKLNPVRFEIKENIIKYYKLSPNKPIKLRVFGPGRIRFLTRAASQKLSKRSYYKIIIMKKNVKILSFNLSTTPSTIAKPKEKGSEYPVIWKSRNISFKVPQGINNYSFIVSGSVKDQYLGRFIFSKSKSKSKADLYAAKKHLISEELPSEQNDKKKWKRLRIKVKKNFNVTLKVKKKYRTYYRLTYNNPLRFTNEGSGKIKLILRVENTFRMRGKINFRLMIKRNMKLKGTYGFSSFPSETVSYKNEKDKIPGTSRNLILKVQKGRQIYTLINPDRGKNLLVRMLSDHLKTGSNITVEKTSPVSIQGKKEKVSISIDKKAYDYFRLKKGNRLRINASREGLIKLLVRKKFKSKQSSGNSLKFKIKIDKKIREFKFLRKRAKNTFIKKKGKTAVSDAVLIPIRIKKSAKSIDLIPDWTKTDEMYLRIFAAGNNRVNISSRKIGKIAKSIGISTSRKKIVKTKPDLKKRTMGKLKITRKYKPLKKLRINFTLGSYYDSNILKFSKKYSDRFIEPLPKDEGRFRTNSLDDMVVNPALKIELPVRIFKKLRSKIISSLSYSSYINNGIKNSARISFSIDQRLPQRRALRFTFRYIPSLFIRTYRDADLISDFGYTPETFQDMDLSGKILTARFEQRLLKDMKIHISISSIGLDYNDQFIEYNSRDTAASIRFYKNLTRNIRINGGILLRKSNAKGFDNAGETKEISDDYDASFNQRGFIAGAEIKMPLLFRIKNSFSISFRYNKRNYLTLDLPETDPFHAGRKDNYSKLLLSYSISPSKAYSFSLFFKINRRISSRNSDYDAVDLALEKNYFQSIMGVRFNYYFR